MKPMTNTTSPLTTTQILSTPLPARETRKLDLTRGAAQFGIRAYVHIAAKVLADYEEVDPAVGHNVAGTVLAVLSYHLAAGRVGLGGEVFTVGLRRRRDGHLVEVDLALRRTRHCGQECLTPYVVAERECAA